jgi:hypothetical protein
METPQQALDALQREINLIVRISLQSKRNLKITLFSSNKPVASSQPPPTNPLLKLHSRAHLASSNSSQSRIIASTRRWTSSTRSW